MNVVGETIHSDSMESIRPSQLSTYDDWLQENLGGYDEDLFGMRVPRNQERVPALFDEAFARFRPLVEVGKKKFSGGNILNTATSKEDIISQAEIVGPHFLLFMDEFLRVNPSAQASAGPENVHLIKAGEGLDFRLRWKEPAKLHDMLRTTVFSPTVSTLRQSVDHFIAFCKGRNKDVSIVNYYDNIAKFGAGDRVDLKHPFGYVGVHVSVPFTVEVQSTVEPPATPTTPSAVGGSADSLRGESADEPKNPTTPTAGPSTRITMVAEVQFHPRSVFDGTSTCLKEVSHPIYRAFANGEMTALAARDIECVKKIRVAYEAHYAYALASTPL